MLTPDPEQDPEMAARLRAKVLAAITDREREFLHWVSHPAEYTYKQIAAHMGVSIHAVEGYKRTLSAKFTIYSKQGLVTFAYLWGLAAQHSPWAGGEAQRTGRGLSQG